MRERATWQQDETQGYSNPYDLTPQMVRRLSPLNLFGLLQHALRLKLGNRSGGQPQDVAQHGRRMFAE